MWIWRQIGELWHDDIMTATGYSGFGEGKNCPAKQNIACVGPIPQGSYKICGPPFETDTHGPYVLRLLPDKANQMFGRSGFLIHGDSVKSPGCASEGCIVLALATRKLIWTSGDLDLKVTA